MCIRDRLSGAMAVRRHTAAVEKQGKALLATLRPVSYTHLYLQMCGHFFVEASKADKILNFFQKSCHKRSVSNVD